MHLVLIWAARPSGRGRVLAALPILAVVGTCTLATLAVRRAFASSDHYVMRMNPDPMTTLLTLGRQTSGALPLSYFAFDPDGLFGAFKAGPALLRWIVRGDALLVTAAALAVASLILNRRPEAPVRGGPAPRRRVGLIAATGLLMAILPAVLIALSVRYQGEVDFGRAYTPVFAQYFGVGVLLALAARGIADLLAWHRASGLTARLGLAAALDLTTGLTYRANCRVADALTAPSGTPYYHEKAAGQLGHWHYQRVNLDAALRAGLMDGIPPFTVVKLAHEYPMWHDFPHGIVFYATYASKLFLITPPSAEDPASEGTKGLRGIASSKPTSPSPPLRLRDECAGRESGFVVLAKLEADRQPRTREFRLFVRDPRIGLAGPGEAFAVVGDTVVLSAGDLKLLRSGPGWVLLSYRSETPIDPDSIRPRLGPSAPPPRPDGTSRR